MRVKTSQLQPAAPAVQNRNPVAPEPRTDRPTYSHFPKRKKNLWPPPTFKIQDKAYFQIILGLQKSWKGSAVRYMDMPFARPPPGVSILHNRDLETRGPCPLEVRTLLILVQSCLVVSGPRASCIKPWRKGRGDKKFAKINT